MSQRTYTIDQVAVAARELREAAGAQVERFTGGQVISLLENEIRMLRERGFTDERISGLFTGFDIEVKTSQIERRSVERRSNAPGNLIRRMIWSRMHDNRFQTDEGVSV